MGTSKDMQEQPESTIGHRPSELQEPGHGATRAEGGFNPKSSDIPGALKPAAVARKEQEERSDRPVDKGPPAVRGPEPGRERDLPPDSFSRTREDIPPSLSTPGPKVPP